MGFAAGKSRRDCQFPKTTIPQSASLTAPFTQGGLKSVLGFCFALGLGPGLSAAVVIAAGLVGAFGLVPGGGWRGAHRRLFTAAARAAVFPGGLFLAALRLLFRALGAFGSFGALGALGSFGALGPFGIRAAALPAAGA